MNKNSDYNTLAERKEQLFQAQKDDFTNALVAAIDASNALGLDHSVELLLDSMIDDFCKEELNFSVGTYTNYPASILGVKVNE
jgi:hypothetical protein